MGAQQRWVWRVVLWTAAVVILMPESGGFWDVNAVELATFVIVVSLSLVVPVGRFVYHFFGGLSIADEDWVATYQPNIGSGGTIQMMVSVKTHRQVGPAAVDAAFTVNWRALKAHARVDGQSGGVLLRAHSNSTIQPLPPECAVTVTVTPDAHWRAKSKQRSKRVPLT